MLLSEHDPEVQAARQRLIAKHGPTYGIKRGWINDAKAVNKLSVKLKVIRKPGVLGKYCQLWRGNDLILERYIFPTTTGDYKSVKDFLDEQEKYWLITNLPAADDDRYYVRLLAALQGIWKGSSMGVIMDNGETCECYTVDDLIDAGYCKSKDYSMKTLFTRGIPQLPEIKLSECDEGTYFTYLGRLYLKIKAYDGYNAVDLDKNLLASLHQEVWVTPYKTAHLTLRD